jgi:prepilin-type N-terminal cleavage/methylation domain-containing protein
MERKTVRRSASRGFTIIELMIVVSIIGVLATLAIPYYQKMTARARRAEMNTTISKLRMQFIATYQIQGSFPLPIAASGDSSWNPADPVSGTPALGLPAAWNTTDRDWLNLPSMDGALRLRYQYNVTPDGKTVTLNARGKFQGIGSYSYSESWSGSDPAGLPTEVPTF